MASLADHWEEERQTCIDVLCAYLRTHFNPDPPDDPEKLTWHGERQVRQTVVRVIVDRLRGGDSVSWVGHDLDFKGAVFAGGEDFEEIHVEGCVIDFDNARFFGDRISFRSANVGDILSFRGARFSVEEFSSDLVDVFGDLDFDRAEFVAGTLSFWSATFAAGKSTFRGAKFLGGTLDIRRPRSWDAPPVFDEEVLRVTPEGLLLPEGWQPSGASTVEGAGER